VTFASRACLRLRRAPAPSLVARRSSLVRGSFADRGLRSPERDDPTLHQVMEGSQRIQSRHTARVHDGCDGQ
jgi:hypothetical protein